ncbi:Gfo/Idh/MocA family protein [Falsiroseomonas sp. HW251]|uniref:Gfo/Idh/MocA family protein n=1 Tax=Falsiroseomonas sp. HW251 TaxID=3390998 RepID=UPI003D3172DB
MVLRGALVGCGFFARNHLAAWREVAGVEIVATCDLQADKAAALAAEFAIPRSYADAAAMAAEERLDFVDVVTTVESHRALVELFAQHGVAVVCQKPFARDLGEGRAMVEACASAGVPIMVHENWRWQAPLLAVKQVLDSGAIGSPQVARIAFRHAYDIYSGQPYLLKETRLALMDIGIHVLDVARSWLGETTRIACRAQRIDPRVAGEDSVSVLLDHEGGARSFVDFCFATQLHPDPFPQTLVDIQGSAGRLRLGPDFRLTVATQNGTRESVVDAEVPAWGARPWHVIQDSVRRIQRHWVECLHERRPAATSGADNLRTLQLVELAYASAAAGRALPVEPLQ